MGTDTVLKRPLVLLFGGLDPSGAGLQADIETCFALGCHALPIATSLTIQSTACLDSVEDVRASIILAQARRLLDDCSAISACKIGLLPSIEAVEVVAEITQSFCGTIPIIIDPVSTASSGGRLTRNDTNDTIQKRLLPLVTLVTPNLTEAITLTGESDCHRAGIALSLRARGGALLTGTDASQNSAICHYLYRSGELHTEYRWPKITGKYHGTGCTLSSAVAAFMARGATLDRAVAAGLSYTWHAVRCAHSIGGEQMIPGRWSDYERG